MYNLFLIWDLDITPADKNIGEIKAKLNFEELKKYSLKNEDVYKHRLRRTGVVLRDLKRNTEWMLRRGGCSRPTMS